MINRGRAGNIVVDIVNNYRARRVVGTASIKRFHIAVIWAQLRCGWTMREQRLAPFLVGDIRVPATARDRSIDHDRRSSVSDILRFLAARHRQLP